MIKAFFFFSVLPKVDRNLENKSVALNTTFTMKCVEAGFPSPEVNWTKNGTLLPNAGNIITINHTSFDDEGQYECSARNRIGKISKTVWIEVTGKCCDKTSSFAPGVPVT